MISTCRSNWINSLSNDVMLKPQKPQKVEPFFKHHPSCYNHNNNNTWGGDDGTMRLKTFFHFLFSISFSYGVKISENVRFQFNFKLTISENFVTLNHTGEISKLVNKLSWDQKNCFVDVPFHYFSHSPQVVIILNADEDLCECPVSEKRLPLRQRKKLQMEKKKKKLKINSDVNEEK